MSSWTFGRKTGAGFAFAGVVLIVVAVVGYRSTDRLIENDAWVDHTHEVVENVFELRSLLKDTETGQRGYLLTGEDSYLEPYRTALLQIEGAYAKLRELTGDNPIQQHRLEQLRPLIDGKLAELKLTIEQRRTSLEAALVTVQGNTGKLLMDQIRALLADIQREETTLLARRADDATTAAAITKSLILWGSAAGLALIAVIGWLITRSLSNQIGAAVRHIESSAAELHAAASQQATGSKEQATAMNEITTTISELLATSRQIAESAQRVTQIADQTAGSARSGGGTVDKAHESITGIRRQVDLIVNHMLTLGKNSQQIGSVLDIVSELAEQTNILAINATIEAAGAGEAGKRFAVVADEIRKLADRVAGSTKEIRTLIDDVRSAVNTTVMATETGSKTVDAGSRQFGDVAIAFKQIGGLVSTTNEASREIELSTKQQTTAVEQVNVAIANVGQAARETEASSSQTLQTASQLASLSKELLLLVQPQA